MAERKAALAAAFYKASVHPVHDFNCDLATAEVCDAWAGKLIDLAEFLKASGEPLSAIGDLASDANEKRNPLWVAARLLQCALEGMDGKTLAGLIDSLIREGNRLFQFEKALRDLPGAIWPEKAACPSPTGPGMFVAPDGSLILKAGDATPEGDAADLTITAGAGGPQGKGGNVNIAGGLGAEPTSSDIADGPGDAVKLKQPPEDALACYRSWVATGLRQLELADVLTNELKRPVSQGQVSRWIRQVRKWLEAGNVLPALNASPITKPIAMDPDRIDLGRRIDKRRPRPSGDHDD